MQYLFFKRRLPAPFHIRNNEQSIVGDMFYKVKDIFSVDDKIYITKRKADDDGG